MSEYDKPISVALETTCRAGGLAVGAGDALVEVLAFDAARRAATQVVTRLDELFVRMGLAPGAIDEVYISAGPGSFTGTRVGITVARTLAQALPGARCVSVPTTWAVAERAAELPDVANLAVVLDARHGRIFHALFRREAGRLVETVPGRLGTVEQMLAESPRPLHVTGEGLGYHEVAAEGVIHLDDQLWLPSAGSVWTIGRRLAKAGQFTEYHQLQPIYTATPEAVRKWDQLRPGE